MKLRLKNTVLIGFSFLSIMLLWQGYNWFVPILLDAKLEEIFNNLLGDAGLTQFIVGSIMGFDNLIALFMIPFVSKMSDKTVTRIGKRVPFIIFGISVALLAFAAVPIFEHGSLWIIVPLLLLVMVAMNVYRSPAVALMPDITPKPLRTRGNAVINILGGIGTGVGYIICYVCSDKILNTTDLVPILMISAIMFICLIIIMLFVKEDKFKKEMYEDVKLYAEKTNTNPNDYLGDDEDDEKEKAKPESTKLLKRSLIFMLAAILFYYMSTNAVETFMSLYSIKILGSESLGIELMAMLAVSNFAFMIPSALLAEKYGRKSIMRIGSILMASGAFVLVLMTKFTYFMLIPFGVFGIGMSMMITNMYPAIVSYCGRKDYAKFTGYYYTATMLAQAITPMLAGLVTSTAINSSMHMLMPYACFFMVLSIVMLYMVKEDPNIATRKKDETKQS